ncbi:LacI family DNA-binding transcriptional regulator [Gilvimarinus sp. 1_MG-2023]|uniref:LacI family DNA-binding transcriptional regulator n=1 Tax=Gilvimarinus sp. 1_MG-2023 TaxID=3062638 RepID=UPI0026E19CD1|nr:LacI family DNA-binding transcriptional regulator [Gilvimarinus sp. 1_MG-2023]MDO6748077.1 LacI family DNA-binding transcriptional regulator [Gilvimarinus sp. 1_MG-2023]
MPSKKKPINPPKDKKTKSSKPSRKQSVTLHDVAAKAGVGSMTVSRVVNGSTSVSPEMRERVEKVIRELNYVPNLAARAARSGQQRIGIIFSNPKSSNLGEFLMGAFAASGQRGCQLLIEPLLAHSEPIDALKKLIELGVEGVILPPPICDSLEAQQLAAQKDVLPLSFASGSPRLHSPAVLIDDFSGARAMTHHLISLGHKKIAFVKGDPAHSPAENRLHSYLAAMAEAVIEVPDQWMPEGDFSYRCGLEVGKSLLQLPVSIRPTAIFACNDEMATGLIAVAHGLGLKVPEDVSIAGFDDTALASAVWPQLTTIHQPIAEMAETAVTMLADILAAGPGASKYDGVVKHYVAPYKLIARGSTGPVAK